MSKSLGNVLDPFEVMDRFGTDALRYYCFREVSFGQDGGVSTITFGERYETELANEFGNLASRTLTMIGRYRDGVVPGGRTSTRRSPPTSTASPRRSRALLDQAEITQALERIWQRVRRLNRYVEERAPWQLAKDEAKAGELDTTLRSLAEGLRVGHGAAHAVHPGVGGEAARRARRAGRRRLEHAAATAPTPAGRPSRSSPPLFPKPRVIDSHTHLDRGPAPEAELVAAGARGRRHAHPHDRDGRARRAAPRSPPPRPTPRCSPRSATTRTRRPATTTRSPTSCASSPRHPRCRAIGETGLDDYRDYAPRADQERAFRAQIELARELGKPLVIHTRAAEDDTIATLAETRTGLEVILHCFSMPDRLEECLDHGWWISFAGNVTYPKAHGPGGGRRARPARPPAGRDRRAVPDAAGRAQGAQPAGLRRRTPRASSPSAAASPTRSWRPRSRPTRPGSSAGERAPGAAEPAPAAAVRHPPEPRARPELPRSTRTSSTSSAAPRS